MQRNKFWLFAVTWSLVDLVLGTIVWLQVPLAGELIFGALGQPKGALLYVFYVGSWIFTMLVWTFIQGVFTVVLGPVLGAFLPRK